MSTSLAPAIVWCRVHADEIAAAVLAVLWLTGATSGGIPSERLHLTAFAVCGLLMTVPFAWRRRAPQLVAIAVFVSGVALSFLVSSNLPIGFVLSALASAYSLGAWARSRSSWLTLAAVLIAVGISNARSNDAGAAGLILTPMAFIVAPWAVGALVARLRRERGALRRLTAKLELEQQELARVSVIEERARIARELHDIVAHSISVMVVQAGAAEQCLDPQAPAREPLAAIRLTGQQALVEMRRLLGVLRTEDGPSTLAPQPGLENVADLVDAARSTGLDVAVEIRGETTPLPRGLDVAAYRLVQESFSNVRKHARAVSARVALTYTTTCLTIEVSDDGVGDEDGTGTPGHGLIGMRERVSLYGGELECGPLANGGWQVRAQLPLTG